MNLPVSAIQMSVRSKFINNLFTITKYSGFTPEIFKGDGTPLNGGIELNTYPSTRTFSFGVNLGF